jgi:hypothetical protein
MKHYHAMSGDHGCIPDNNTVCGTYQQAVDSLVDLFELGKTRAARLKKDGYLELTPYPNNEPYGAEYCEIIECDDSECIIGEL